VNKACHCYFCAVFFSIELGRTFAEACQEGKKHYSYGGQAFLELPEYLTRQIL